MQAVLCDNCRKPAPNMEAQSGWRKLGRVIVKEVDPTEGMPPALRQMIGGGAPPQKQLAVDTDHDLCTDECLLLFVKNGWQSAMPQIEEPNVKPKEQAT
jgi:hypothetical protein